MIRIRFDPNCFDDDLYWSLHPDEGSMEDMEARGVIHDGDPVVLYYDDDHEAFEVRAHLVKEGPGGSRWQARRVPGSLVRSR